MNLESLRQKLLAAAKANPPRDHVPYAFEKRILARLKDKPALDLSALWARALWRAAAPCVAITLLLGAWSLTSGIPNSASLISEEQDLSQHFEQTMLATVDDSTEEIW